MEKRYEILLFDADGTLLDFDRSEHAAMEKISRIVAMSFCEPRS